MSVDNTWAGSLPEDFSLSDLKKIDNVKECFSVDRASDTFQQTLGERLRQQEPFVIRGYAKQPEFEGLVEASSFLETMQKHREHIVSR